MGILGRKKKNKEELEKKMVKPKENISVKSDTKSGVVRLSSHLSELILSPHITEKAHHLTNQRQYIFNILKIGNKMETKKAVERIYNVKVDKVRMINIPSKSRRLGRTIGRKSGYKKAIVTLKEGFAIEIMPQ